MNRTAPGAAWTIDQLRTITATAGARTTRQRRRIQAPSAYRSILALPSLVRLCAILALLEPAGYGRKTGAPMRAAPGGQERWSSTHVAVRPPRRRPGPIVP